MNDKDRNIYLYTQNKDGGWNRGESIGITTSITSFHNSDANDGEGSWTIDSVINPNDQSGNRFQSNIIGNIPPMFDDYMANARNNKQYDFKVTNGTKQAIDGIDPYRGMPIGKTGNNQVIYTSARDIGNMTAGYVAAANGMPWGAARVAFDAYQGGIEGISTRNAELYGGSMGNRNVETFQKSENLRNSINQGVKSLWNWITK